MNSRMKMVAAALGAGVIAAMGALTIALGGSEAHATVPAPLSSGAGETTTKSTAPTTIATPVASPEVKAPAYGAE